MMKKNVFVDDIFKSYRRKDIHYKKKTGNKIAEIKAKKKQINQTNQVKNIKIGHKSS